MGCSKHCFSWCRKVAVKMQGYKRPDDWACLCECRVLKLQSFSCWQITSLIYWGPSGLLSMDPTSAGVLRVSPRHCPHILPQGQHRYLWHSKFNEKRFTGFGALVVSSWPGGPEQDDLKEHLWIWSRGRTQATEFSCSRQVCAGGCVWGFNLDEDAQHP